MASPSETTIVCARGGSPGRISAVAGDTVLSIRLQFETKKL
jgi:hypothetical protein